MELNNNHIRRFALFYLICFTAYYLWSYVHGLTLATSDPVYFTNKADITGNIMMLGGMQHRIIQSEGWRVTLDLLYLLLPFLLVISVYTRKYCTIAAILVSLYSMFYNYFLSIMTFISIEVLVSWMLVPLALAGRSEKSSYYLIHCLRLLFIIFFFSTAVWKIRAGGIFNIEQMAAILSSQHAYLLVNDSDWFTNMIRYLVVHEGTSCSLYIAAFLAEFIFVIGLFSTKYDRLLLIIFCMFIVFNYFLMKINYFTWLPFAATLYFSRFREPGVGKRD